jgi:N-acetylglucosamine-6-phosphate deacetylase
MEGGSIRAVGSRSEIDIPRGCSELALTGKTIVPGFVDLHLHGGGGYGLSDRESIEGAIRYHGRCGTTAMLLTVEPLALPALKERLALIKECCSELRGDSLPEIIGIHLEGPFLNKERSGALSRMHFGNPDPALAGELIDASGGALKVMTLAPELPGGLDVIGTLREAGVIAALGHSDASYEEARAAFGAGVNHATHLFNAMRGIHHRDPGCAVAALLDPGVIVEVVVDGHHLHPGMVGMVHRMKGTAGMVLVSDAVALAGEPAGAFTMGGQRITVKEGRAVNREGTLSGSLLTMAEAVRNTVDYGTIPLGDAVKLAAGNPAKCLGIADRKGRLAQGADADFVVLNKSLEVDRVYIAGKEVTA